MRSAILIVLVGLLLPAAAASSNTGSICVAPISAEDRAADRSDPTGNRTRELKYDFFVQIGKQEKVKVPTDKGVLITELTLRGKHLIRIWDGDELIESFYFTFKDRGGSNLCLYFVPFYRTWRLDPPERRPWCRCNSSVPSN